MLLTEDKDFGELLVRHAHPSGVIFVRKRGADVAEVCAAVDAILARGADKLARSYWVVDGRRTRVRPLPLG